MAQVTINKKATARLLKKLELLKNPTRKSDAQALGNLIVREMKKDIANLKSPIRGRGAFPALKDSYKKVKQRAGKGGKPDLKFTGKFLKSLRATVNKLKRGGYSATIGFSSAFSKTKELGHREGANGQKERPIIPNSKEGFNNHISKEIKTFFLKRMRDIIRR